MSEEAARVRHVSVERLDQGVGYRELTRRWALRLNISGWARGRSDGAIEALVRGAAADVEAILPQMRSGPRGAEAMGLRTVEHGEREAEEVDVLVVRATA